MNAPPLAPFRRVKRGGVMRKFYRTSHRKPQQT
ncbi:MAG: hypothetical protein QOE47_2180, partial [Pyrinomonadaceae bacterium]|nr:hypothetical protein [Pyrinomonadaceae bacterium]